MPAPAVCPRCRHPLPAAPPDGVCPGCGSRLTGETPPADTTGVLTPDEVSPLDPTASAPPSAGDDQTLSAVRPAPPPVLPHHTALTFLGDGGMGEVFRAVHVKTDRVVAVKFVHRRYAGDPGPLARFDTEVKALARARHPNVVTIYEVGEADGRPYFSMEYLGGGTLAQLARRRPADFREAARLVAAAADGIAAAHAVGVLHRDVKPGNILLTEDGTPKVTDFGLAKLAGSASRMTISGDVIGTPAYMAPEQASGRQSRVDERTDVYGLGAVLYEVLTGRPPFRGVDRSDTLRQVQTQSPEPPDRIRPGVPAGLVRICLKCLEKDQSLRYTSANELADDLNQWVAGNETVGRPAGRLRRAWRGIVRNRLTVAVGLLSLTLVAALWFTRAQDPRVEIERKLARGEEVVLVPAKGPPGWSEWADGAVLLTESDENDGTCGFQTATTSLLTLLRDPMTDSYRLSADLRHLRLTADDGGVGVFVGLRDVPARPDLRVTRYLGFEYADFWRMAELKMPNLKPRHGLDGRDYLVVRDGNLTRPSWLSERSFPFTPSNQPPNEWRTIVVDVTPVGVTVFWEPAGVDSPPALHIPAPKIEARTAEHNRNQAGQYPGFAMPAETWDPRGALGVFARASVVAFRNVKVRPIPSP